MKINTKIILKNNTKKIKEKKAERKKKCNKKRKM